MPFSPFREFTVTDMEFTRSDLHLLLWFLGHSWDMGYQAGFHLFDYIPRHASAMGLYTVSMAALVQSAGTTTVRYRQLHSTFSPQPTPVDATQAN